MATQVIGPFTCAIDQERYRVVIVRDGERAGVALEQLTGTNALGEERWVPADSPTVASLAALKEGILMAVQTTGTFPALSKPPVKRKPARKAKGK